MPNPSVAVDALQKALDEERRLRIKAEEHITYLTKTTDYTPPTQEHVENLQEVMDDIEKHPDYEDVVGGFETQLQEYRKEAVKDLNEEIRDLHAKIRGIQTLNENKFKRMEDKNESLEKKLNSTKRVAKSVNAKLQKQIRTMKDDWYDATNKMGQQISDLTKEVKELKEDLRKRQTNGLACMNSWERKSKQQLQQIDNHCQELIAKDKIIEYHELREMYLEKYIQEFGCSHQFREMVEETAHKNGEEKHVAIVFDEEEDEDEDCEENVSAFAKLVPDDMKLSPLIPQARKLDEEHIWNQDNNCIYEKDRIRNGPVGEMKWDGNGWVKCFYPCD